ncbi:MAG: carboxylating nicotinate-nucleotide diphosphorylase [bacterium]
MTLEEIVHHALLEDIGHGDVTTQCTVDPDLQGEARIWAKSAGVLSGLKPFMEVFRQVDPEIKVVALIQDGSTFEVGEVVIYISGPVAGILTGERTALNFLQRLSGIASLTRKYVEEIKGTRAQILDTRKTTPLLRFLEKEAVLHGGGTNHRLGLYDMVLVKENHEFAAGSISNALNRIIAECPGGMLIEVEIQDSSQLEQVLRFPIARIMLDNFSLPMIQEAVTMVAGRVPLEVSGGVTLENVRKIASIGVDYISVGALTHSAPAIDFSLLFDRG